MGNRKNLPQHATPTPSLRLIPAHFTEKNLRGQSSGHRGIAVFQALERVTANKEQ